MAFCLKQPKLSSLSSQSVVVTPRKLVEQIIAIPTDDSELSNGNELAGLRHMLFAAEATTVLLALISSGEIQVQPSECRDHIVDDLCIHQHKYRISTAPDKYDEQNDASFRTDRIPLTSIAVSRTTDYGGSYLDPLYQDYYASFEGAGAISSWQISLPKTLRQFDYTSIRDVVLKVRYTFVASGGLLESSASQAQRSGRNLLRRQGRSNWITSGNTSHFGHKLGVVQLSPKT